jgi:hypothetical protein
MSAPLSPAAHTVRDAARESAACSDSSGTRNSEHSTMTTHSTERHALSYKIGLLFGWFGRILDKILAYLVSSRGRTPLAIRYPLGKAFLLEIRNFVGRIELLYSKCVWAGVPLGPCYQQTPSGCLLPDIQTIENTRRIEQLKATYPWTTLIDQHILLVTRNDQEQSTTLDWAAAIRRHRADVGRD